MKSFDKQKECEKFVMEFQQYEIETKLAKLKNTFVGNHLVNTLLFFLKILEL